MSESNSSFGQWISENVIGGVRDLAASTSSMVDSAVNETVVRLAVTGLSRAGKTTFITSAIHNLLALGKGYPTLPAVQKVLGQDRQNRLKSVRIVPPAASTVPIFDYRSKLRELASDAPTWPSRTEDLAQITLEIELKRTSVLGRQLGDRRILLQILDYPGEWLVDLPMMEQGYGEWSRQMLETICRQPRADIFADFLQFLNSIDPHKPADDRLLQHGHGLFRGALGECRDRFGLRRLQPGRFLCPGSRADAPFMWFFPVSIPKGASIRWGSTAALLRDRFEAYKADMKANFFDSHFANFSRQIVLVDVLGALHAGKEAFADTVGTIGEIAKNMPYGFNIPWPLQEAGIAGVNVLTAGINVLTAGMVSKAISEVAPSQRIERLAFVATKADHVPALRRDNLRNLLAEMAKDATRHTGSGRVTFHVASSVLATRDGKINDGGRPLEVVFATPLGEDKARAFYPGDVPSAIPNESFWSDRYFEMPVFKPRKIDPAGEKGIEHLGLDEVLASILEGVLE